jgi:hypothetical protein
MNKIEKIRNCMLIFESKEPDFFGGQEKEWIAWKKEYTSAMQEICEPKQQTTKNEK